MAACERAIAGLLLRARLGHVWVNVISRRCEGLFD